MAKKVMQDSYYRFIPSEDTVVLPRVIQRENLMLITNVTTNQVIYNFSDPDLNAITYTVSGSSNNSSTTIVLNYNCEQMEAEDKLQIIYDEYDEKITPSDLLVDTVGKMRMSEPQALIDTDFEYGTQPNKWEVLTLTNNYPTFYSRGSGGNSFAIDDIVGDGTTVNSKSKVYVLTSSNHSLVSNSVVSVQETKADGAEGTFAITVPTTKTASGIATGVFTLNAHGFESGQPIAFSAQGGSNVSLSTIYYVININANTFSVATTINGAAVTSFSNGTPTVATGRIFTYLANSRVPKASIKDGNLTTILGGGIFEGAHIPGGLTGGSWSITVTGINAYIDTEDPHGIVPGTPILINGATQTQTAGSQGALDISFLNGSWVVSDVENSRRFRFELATAAASNILIAPVNAAAFLYCKPDSYVQHTAYNGGVLLTTGNNVVNIQQIRQTRKTFRYQSGKGIQFSTGTKFTPSYDINTISCNALLGDVTVIVKTVQDHGLQENSRIELSGVEVIGGDVNPYNSNFLVSGIIDEKTFSFNTTINSKLNFSANLNPGGDNALVTVTDWAGAATRVGMYTEQNGMYFEYDGQKLYACRRFSNKPIFGNVEVVKDAAVVTGTGTVFRKQLMVGQSIVIKGMTYRVTSIDSDTIMTISPAYRAQSVTNAKVYKIQEVRIPQDEFNVDRLDGTGPSGYILDPTKMQMMYIDYTWYGAGFIRYGLRATNGDIVYCHRIANNNVNSQAYMRSGNLPARYEVANVGPITRMISAAQNEPSVLDAAGTTLTTNGKVIYVESIEGWRTTAPSGILGDTIGYISISNGDKYEIASYKLVGSFNAKVGGYPITVDRLQTQYVSLGGVEGSGTISHPTSGDYSLTINSGNTFIGQVVPGNIIFAEDGTKLGRVSSVAVDGLSISISNTFNGKAWSIPLSTELDANNQQIPYTNVGFTIGQSIGLNDTAVAKQATSFSPDSTIPNGTGTKQVSVQVITQTCAPSLSHWGSSVIMDGKFDEDKALQINARMRTALSVAQNTSNALLSIRIAPSADNGIGRNFGKRDVINTMQLAMQEIQASTTGRFLIEGYLNANTIVDPGWAGANNGSTLNYPERWEFTPIGTGSLAQVIYHGSGATITGGDNIFSFYTEGATTGTITTYDLSTSRELGTSILSGDGNGWISGTATATAPGFPNGPDVLTIVATNLETTAARTVSAKVSWTEAQA
jgi:hypothetical protein